MSADALQAFSEGRMSSARAMQALGLRDYAQLLLALGQAGLHPPRLPEAQLAAMQRTLVSLVREAL
jgi:hypothetical protein